MGDVEAEAPLFAQTPGERHQFLLIKLLDMFTAAADQVNVLGFVDVMVGRGAVRQVHVRDQVKLLEELQRAIDGGDIHPRGVFDHCRVYLFRRGMAKSADRIQHHLPLRSQSQATITQQVRKLGHGPMIMRGVSVLAVLGRGLLPADSPFIRADDLGLTRGDGIFETLHVRGGQPWLLDEHLTRMAESAKRMDLPLPDLRELAELACSKWPSGQEGALKIVCTRGPDGFDQVTCYATVNPVAATSIAARDNGIAVKSLSLGYPAHARAEAPWLLGGVKSLSYAINMASQRYAQAQGADDALWVSSDGYALEAPTSTLVWRTGDDLLTVPTEETGILPGTTARYAMDHAGELGLTAGEEMITPSWLTSADGVWLLSSIRGIAPIRSLDGVELRMDSDTPLRQLLGF